MAKKSTGLGKGLDSLIPDFYDEDGENIDSVRLVDFIERIMNWKKTNQEND